MIWLEGTPAARASMAVEIPEGLAPTPWRWKCRRGRHRRRADRSGPWFPLREWWISTLRCQHVRRADDARPVPPRGKCARERRLRPPARAVSGSDDARTDAILQVRDRGLDAHLHFLAAQVIPAEHDVDGYIGELALRPEAGIHHARVRTGREHGDAAAAHDGGDEPLV